jgi:glycosyltransferase involved in cell wall biosynthesis
MKILQVCSYLYPALNYGGPAKVVYDLSIELSKNNLVTIYTTDVWDSQRRIKRNERLKSKKNFQVVYFENLLNGLAYTMRFFTGFGMVIKFIKDFKKTDVVHMHDVFILPQILVGYIAVAIKKPLFVSPHGVLDPVRFQRRSLIKRLLFSIVEPLFHKAIMIIATSPKEAKDLKKLGFSNVLTIPNGIPLNNVKPSHQYSRYKSKKITLLYVGKLHPQKGLFELLQAFEKTNNAFQLLIAGPNDGSVHEIQNYIQDKKLSDIHLLGFVNDKQKQELFELADVFVYPSHAEGFSISILEALAAGLPVLITDGCNFPEVREFDAGFVVKNEDLIKQLKQALMKISRSPNDLKTMKKNAKKLVKDKYTIDRMAQHFEHLYQTTL